MMKKLTFEDWQLIDLVDFREKFPELKFDEHNSIAAFWANKPTALLSSLLEKDTDHSLQKRIVDYIYTMEETFKKGANASNHQLKF